MDANRTIDACVQRTERARRIADELRHDPRLHRLAMATVFVLEDLHEALVRGRPYKKATPPNRGG